MNIDKKLVEFHLAGVQGMYFSELINHDRCQLLFCDLVEDAYYNFLVTYDKNLIELINKYKSEFQKRNRNIAIYIPGNFDISEITSNDINFSLYACDSYMSLKNSIALLDHQIDNNIKIYTVNESEADKYCDVFATAYSSDDPNDPYGKLPDCYRNALRKSFNYSSSDFKFDYYLAKFNGEDAAVVSTISNNHIIGVYGLGTIHEFRRKGIGTALMQHIFKISTKRNIKIITLQTECGSSVEKWYNKLGFESLFSMKYYDIKE